MDPVIALAARPLRTDAHANESAARIDAFYRDHGWDGFAWLARLRLRLRTLRTDRLARGRHGASFALRRGRA